MNRTKIEWCDYTWNPITGCERLCDFDKDGKPDCYAVKQAIRFGRSFKPTFHPDRLDEILKLKAPTERDNQMRKPWIAKAYPENWLIFPCSIADIFAPWTKAEWRLEVLAKMESCPTKHIFQLLTHSPENLIGYRQNPDNFWIGISIHSQSDVEKVGYLRDVEAGVRFISIEPMLEQIDLNDVVDAVDWVIVGQLTKAKRWPIQPRWIEALLNFARGYNIPLFIKDNVGWSKKIQEFPVSQN